METVITTTIIASAILLAVAALGTALGFAILGVNFRVISSSARISKQLTNQNVYCCRSFRCDFNDCCRYCVVIYLC